MVMTAKHHFGTLFLKTPLDSGQLVIEPVSADPQRRETRRDEHGPIAFLARADGYVMARRPRCLPFCLTERAWLALPVEVRS